MSQAATTQYTKPALRERLKQRIVAGSRGGKPGQWSARKAQLLAAEYKKAGGSYRGKRGKQQRHLRKWTREKWTTADGRKAQRRGSTARYLPKKAWSALTPAQKRATDRKKRSASRRGRQYVSNTGAAKSARRRATNRLERATSAFPRKRESRLAGRHWFAVFAAMTAGSWMPKPRCSRSLTSAAGSACEK
jgi:hypothetical protein